MKYTGPLPDNILRRMSPEDRAPMGKAGLSFDEAVAATEIKLERELHRQIEQELNRRGITYRHDAMNRKTTCRLGMPDFMFAIAGHPCAIECKAPGALLSPEQKEVMFGLRADGWRYVICYRLEQVIELFTIFKTTDAK